MAVQALSSLQAHALKSISTENDMENAKLFYILDFSLDIFVVTSLYVQLQHPREQLLRGQQLDRSEQLSANHSDCELESII